MRNRELPRKPGQTIACINKVLYVLIITAVLVMVFVLFKGMKHFF